MVEIQRVAVIGAGTMGSGIAQVLAAAGRAVVLVDVSPDLVARGLDTLRANTARLVAKERLTADEQSALLGRVAGATSLEEAAQSQLVIEAIIEKAEVKAQVFGTLDQHAPADTILASNTSSISITRIAAATRRPDRVVGMHFMNPAPVMKLVEVVAGLSTSEATLTAITELARALGKTPVRVADSAGFALNRILIPMLNEAIYALHEGVASAEDIDTVMTLGANHPLGPLALADLIGLDTVLAIMSVLHAELGDDKYRPCPLLRQMVAANHLGRKTGRGFFEYGD